MTDSNNSKISKAPDYAAFHVRDRKGGDAIWTRVGSAWQHTDGKGFNIQIETVPLDGRISLRSQSEKAA